jgi:hypothetical protein
VDRTLERDGSDVRVEGGDRADQMELTAEEVRQREVLPEDLMCGRVELEAVVQTAMLIRLTRDELDGHQLRERDVTEGRTAAVDQLRHGPVVLPATVQEDEAVPGGEAEPGLDAQVRA